MIDYSSTSIKRLLVIPRWGLLVRSPLLSGHQQALASSVILLFWLYFKKMMKEYRVQDGSWRLISRDQILLPSRACFQMKWCFCARLLLLNFWWTSVERPTSTKLGAPNNGFLPNTLRKHFKLSGVRTLRSLEIHSKRCYKIFICSGHPRGTWVFSKLQGLRYYFPESKILDVI